jgi:hypothetical protein
LIINTYLSVFSVFSFDYAPYFALNDGVSQGKQDGVCGFEKFGLSTFYKLSGLLTSRPGCPDYFEIEKKAITTKGDI